VAGLVPTAVSPISVGSRNCNDDDDGLKWAPDRFFGGRFFGRKHRVTSTNQLATDSRRHREEHDMARDVRGGAAPGNAAEKVNIKPRSKILCRRVWAHEPDGHADGRPEERGARVPVDDEVELNKTTTKQRQKEKRKFEQN